jgi:cytochrome d ubiquinol oxidase subunit II
METLWFCLVAIMIAGYVVFDGFDIGAGIVHLFLARSESERRTVIASIGPVWDGNEVWLLAGGGTLYFAFPALYASSFSGFYLPLMIVLWLLIIRGISIEFRNHAALPLWKHAWDVGFNVSSLILAIVFGAALGNVVRGVPLDNSGYFFLPLWSDFRPGSFGGILDWYTVLTGVAAFIVLTMHGALWVRLKTASPIRERAALLASRLKWAVAAFTLLITIVSFSIQPHLSAQFAATPWGYIFPVVAIAGLAGVFLRSSPETELFAFLSSCTFIIGMLCSVAFGLYPLLLPAGPDPALSLTVQNAAAGSYGLHIGLAWWIPGMLLAGGYAVFTYLRFSGKLKVEGPQELH